ncbi:hypothetical protein ACS0TY_031958 [Phlomoides rotata]
MEKEASKINLDLSGKKISEDSRTNLFEEGENDGDNIAFISIYIYIVLKFYLSFN